MQGLNLATTRRRGAPTLSNGFGLAARAGLELPDVGQNGLESLPIAAQVVVLVVFVEEPPRLERLEAVAPQVVERVVEPGRVLLGPPQRRAAAADQLVPALAVELGQPRTNRGDSSIASIGPPPEG